jgi:CheY-like chemotaxis protein
MPMPDERTGEGRIVVVDDEPDTVEFLQRLLEDNGFEVVTASSATEGLQRIRETRPDLVCLDVLMPQESGISLYQKLRSDPDLRRVPVVMSTALSFSRELSKIRYRTLPDGTTIPEPEGIVEKPIDIDQFLQTVRRVMKS